MDIQGKTVLILGGWGLVGKAITRKLLPEKPKSIIITSLHKHEAIEEVQRLQKDNPQLPSGFFIPWWGNILVRNEFKDMNRQEILNDPVRRRELISDIMDDLDDKILKESAIYQLFSEYKPEIVVDCINTATGIAYQDVFSTYKHLRKVLDSNASKEEIINETEKMLAILYIPQLIRHIQILYNTMHEVKTKIFVKIGTSGTGGMGLNIPYTHSEEKPSRVLLSKSAVAGAHTLLLFLMARTPDMAITKEIKPTAAIAWKKIAFGSVKKAGKEIELVDVSFDDSLKLEGKLSKTLTVPKKTMGTLKSVYIDTGENGIFSRGEFEAISAQKQMEFVTPEEIAGDCVFEIKGGNTGHDIINALDNASTHPTYRAGYMQHFAVDKMAKLEVENNIYSVAFEMLGPPRLSKLLFEIHFLRLVAGTMKGIVSKSAKTLSELCTKLVKENDALRNEALSISIPILLSDGKSLLRGNSIKIPVFGPETELDISDENIDNWATAGWIDLREKNMQLWLDRLNELMEEASAIPDDDTSSLHVRTKQYWNYFERVDVGRVVSWIFIHEEKGLRMKD